MAKLKKNKKLPLPQEVKQQVIVAVDTASESLIEEIKDEVKEEVSVEPTSSEMLYGKPIYSIYSF